MKPIHSVCSRFLLAGALLFAGSRSQLATAAETAKGQTIKKGASVGIEMVALGTLKITMGKKAFMPGSPAGTRLVIDFAEIKLDGERLKATKAPLPAGDWLVIGADNVATLDIRFSLQTSDGANILVQGLGRTDSVKFNSGAPCYFTPLFETDDSRYAWLNKIQAVAKGKADGDVVVFELYELR